GPLFGLPVATKDLIDHAGHATTAGSTFYRHHATTTATALGRLAAAGAVVIVRTNPHEFAFGSSSANTRFGPLRNPWAPGLSAGGSSGGSAAAVAAGIVPVALGTDTGRVGQGARRRVRDHRAEDHPRADPPRRRVPAGAVVRHGGPSHRQSRRPGEGDRGDGGGRLATAGRRPADQASHRPRSVAGRRAHRR